ncbi:MAG TPA: heavy metal translocating P-type ATPase [Ktedonobacterales bacterium]
MREVESATYSGDTHKTDLLRGDLPERGSDIVSQFGDDGPPRQRSLRSRLRWLWRVVRRYPLPVATIALLVVSLGFWLFGRGDLAQWTLATIVLVGGIPLLWDTIRQLMRREFGVDVLALLAIGGSFILEQYLAGAIIVLMLSGGEALEAFALRRVRRSLTGLVERAPRIAHVQSGDEVLTVPADEIAVGTEVIVKPGEIIPVDGVVSAGESSVSEADLTGEPTPVRKVPGTLTLSGSVNLDGLLRVQATRRSAESQYAQIIKLVQDAQERKAPIHRLADRYAVWFTTLAIAIAAVAWILSGDSLYALSVLVVATPCPLILATPIAIMSGIDRAAHMGVIAKSGSTIEELGEVEVAIFDKTGTLTLGLPRLTGIERVRVERSAVPLDRHAAVEDAQIVALAAAVEQFSPHILARAVVDAARERGLPLVLATDVEESPGKGVRGFAPVPEVLRSQNGVVVQAAHVRDLLEECGDGVDLRGEGEGKRISGSMWGETIEVAIGNRTFMHRLEIALPDTLLLQRSEHTTRGEIASFIALDRQVVGLLVFADFPRPDIGTLVPALKSSGIKETVLLTGDMETVAQQVGALAGVDRTVAECLPADKSRIVQELESQGRKVLMVGDGVNDAPALATATVGLAMGAQGLTAAAAAADAVLLTTDLLHIPNVVRLGRRVMRVAKQGIWVGIGLSSVAMVVAAFGYLPPTAGALLQEGIDALVILNALRAGSVKVEEN